MATIFISHSQEDTEIASALARELGELGHSPVQSHALQAGRRASYHLLELIQEAGAVVAIITERGLESPNGMEEISFLAGATEALDCPFVPLVVGEMDVPAFLGSRVFLSVDDLAAVPKEARAIASLIESTGESSRSALRHSNTRAARARRLTSLAVAGVAVAGIFVSAFSLLWGTGPSRPRTGDVVELSRDMAAVSQEQVIITGRIRSLEQSVAGLSEIPDQAAYSSELRRLADSSESLNQRLESLESALLEDPAKAVSLPLLQRDVTSLRDAHDSEAQSLRNEIDRVYDQNKWFIGLMFTMALSILGLAVGNLFQGSGRR